MREYDLPVVCTAEIHAEPYPVAHLVLFDQGPAGWSMLVQGPTGDFTELTAELVGDRALPKFATPAAAADLDKMGGHRLRYRFYCDACGDTLPARESGLLQSAIKLVGHGASQAPISTLRRMLQLV